MPEYFTSLFIIAQKDIADARCDRFVLIVTAFLIFAGMTALIVAAIALRTDVMTYNEAKATLEALGKSTSLIATPDFYPLKLMRGFIEHVEIIGAVIGILIGYRSAASERGRQTLALILTRPVMLWQFLLGKILAGVALLSVGLMVTFLIAGFSIWLISDVSLVLKDLLRLGIVMFAAILYSVSFFLLGFISALWAEKLTNALLVTFAIWLVLVLVAPQIGDTMDPDNQVAGGVFKQLHITKPDQLQIMASFAKYETIRNGIEAVSPEKHFERLSFAVLGIKDMYTGIDLFPILQEKISDFLWLFFIATVLGIMPFVLPLNPNRFMKE